MNAARTPANMQFAWIAYGVALLLSVAISVPALDWPWYGDQALFAYGARAIGEGARLYVDFWDNKQPGIYWFFLAGGKLFGSLGAGPRILELIWLTIAAIAATRIVQASGGRTLVMTLTPLATLGTYYATATLTMLTQVESLVALPLVGCVWSAVESQANDSDSRWRWVAFGACAAIVGVFKLVLLPIPFVILAVSLAMRSVALKQAFVSIAWTVLGGGVIAGASLSVFAIQGSLPEALWTTFTYPLGALESVPLAPESRLKASALGFAKSIAPLLPLAFVPLLLLTRMTPTRRHVIALLLAWEIAAIAVIGVQKFSWWRYHFTLLLWPTALLALFGFMQIIAQLAAHRATLRRAAFVAGSACVLFPSGLVLAKALQGIQPSLTGPARRIEGLAIDVKSPAAAAIDAMSDAPLAEATCTKLYVFGDPIIQLAAGAPSALATHGWAWEYFLEFQWKRLPAEVRAAQPAALYVGTGYRKLIEQRSAELAVILGRDYDVVWQGERGMWLARKHSLDVPRCLGPTRFSIPEATARLHESMSIDHPGGIALDAHHQYRRR